MRQWRHCKAGNSLFEVLVVISLICGISFLSFSLVTVTQRLAVRYEVDRLAAIITHMQQKSMLTKQVYRLPFDLIENTYGEGNEHHRLPHGISLGAPGGVMGPPSKPVVEIKYPVSFPGGVVLFYPDGTISAGAVYITDSARSSCYALSCDASEKTHIRCYRFDGGSRASPWALIV